MRSSPLPLTTLKVSEEEDRISALPDDILLHILDRVDDRLHTVFQTSTLSRRWAHLPRLLSRLLIEVVDFFPRGRESCMVDQVMAAYTTAVRRLLSSSSTSSNDKGHQAIIKRLRLSFYLVDPYLCSIGNAVGDFMEHSSRTVALLEFIIYAPVREPSYEQSVVFAQSFISFVHTCPITFRWLNRLFLQALTLGDSDVSTILNACSKLEFLSLSCCLCAIDPVTGEDNALTIDAPQSMLLALRIISCWYPGIHLIQVPKLERLACINWYGADPMLHLGNLPCLNNICLRTVALHCQSPFELSRFLPNSTTLSVMSLDFFDHMIWIKPEGPKHLSPKLRHLREVYLYNIFVECDLNWTMFILEAAPTLNSFHLQLSCHPCERNRCEETAEKVNVVWDSASHEFKHNRLSLLEMADFAVDEKLMKYIRHVMEKAVVLKRVCLLQQQPCPKCDARGDAQSSSRSRRRFPEDEDEKKLLRQQLVDGLSSSVEISIVFLHHPKHKQKQL